MSLGKQIRIARMRQGMTAAELSRAARVNRSYLSRVENDHVQGVSVDVLARLCRALQVRPDTLMEWDQGESVTRQKMPHA